MKSKDRWVNSNTIVYNLGYHIIWCPKYRRKVLIDDVEIRLKELIFDKCKELDCVVHELNIMPDHVHLFVKTKLPNMWTRSYFIESVGHISQQTIEKYIQEQKNK